MALRFKLLFLAVGIFEIVSGIGYTAGNNTSRYDNWGVSIKTVTYGRVTTAATAATKGCLPPTCPPCPAGYYQYYNYAYPCTYTCLCQLSYLSSTTTVPQGSHMSKSLLLDILHNIQNNADALEQMAKGLSDEADIAQDVAELK